MRNNDVDALVTLDPTFGVTPFIKLATESPYYQPTRARVSWLYFYRTEPATNLEVFDQLIARTPQVNSAAASIGKQQERAAIEPPPTEQRFLRVFEQQGFQPAIRLYNEYKSRNAPEPIFSESFLNNLGYRLMGEKRLAQAIEIFKLNVDPYPRSANAYDSLAEAYMASGNKELAIKFYEKSVQLNPNNQSGIEALKRLEGSQ
jgi:tetratricopeptide (TPR) repeat protein